MSRRLLVIAFAVGAAAFGASYAGGQAMRDDDEAAPASSRATPLAPASVRLPELGRGAPLPGFRRPQRARPVAAPVLPPPEPEVVEPPVAPPPPPPSPPPPRPEPPVIFDDSG